VDAARDFIQLQPHFVDAIQQRYELIRPLVLLDEGTPAERAQATDTHPETVRNLLHQFQTQGMPGLALPESDVVPLDQPHRVPEAVRQEIARLKALYPGFHYRELARILFCTFGYRFHHRTVKHHWEQSRVPTPQQLDLWPYHLLPDRVHARLQVVHLYYQGWNKRSISRFLRVSRPTVDRWVTRFEADHMAGLQDHKPGPKSPRKQWFPVIVAIYHLQKRHPDAGEFRIWSLLARPDLSERTVGRIMALNKQVYTDIPHARHPGLKPPPQPHPYKASRPHQFWFIDGRKMDFALDGVKWWSLLMLDGYSRTILAGAVAPAEASWVALMVLYTACRRYGAPETLISDSGGAFISKDFEAVCRRLQIYHAPMESTKGGSYLNWLETHFNVQRRLYDYQFSLTTTPAEFEQAHQAFMALYNSTAHQGLRKEHFDPPIPLAVLGTAQGRRYPLEVLTRKFAHALFPRTTNLYGCVTLHYYHFYVEQGVPRTPVLLWVDGDQVRAVLDNVVLAEYQCHYDWRTHTVTHIRHGVFYTTRFASRQGMLFPFNPQEALILYRPHRGKQPGHAAFVQPQLQLFEGVRIA
jgi:transposase InsO family protein